MDFLEVVGSRRSIRIFKPWEQVEKEKIQRILEVARLTTCPGNLQPWRAIVVERDKLSKEDRETLLACDNYQGAHVNAPVWIYWFADVEGSTADTFRTRVHDLVDLGALPTFYGWTHETIDAAIVKGETAPEGMPAIHSLIHGLPREAAEAVARQETVGVCAVAVLGRRQRRTGNLPAYGRLGRENSRTSRRPESARRLGTGLVSIGWLSGRISGWRRPTTAPSL